MAKKEYAMPEEYTRELQALVELIEQRDEMRREAATFVPEVRAQVSQMIEILDRHIERTEQYLAEWYERRQITAKEHARRSLERTAKHYLFIKKYKPHALERFTAAVLEPEYPEDAEDPEEFFAEIARLADEGYNPPPAQIAENKPAAPNGGE